MQKRQGRATWNVEEFNKSAIGKAGLKHSAHSILAGPSLHVVDINNVPTNSAARVKFLPKKVALWNYAVTLRHKGGARRMQAKECRGHEAISYAE